MGGNRQVSGLRSRSLTVYAWTVDDDAAIQHVAEMGVDGIISNRVDQLAQRLGLQPR